MHRTILTRLLALLLVLGLASAASAAPGERYVKKVDNFVFIIDHSGSMGFDYPGTDMSKESAAKYMLARLNTLIPELDYTGNLVTFAPYDMYTKPVKYDTVPYAKSIDAVPSDVLTLGFAGNPTPLGEGFQDSEELLKVLKGKTAVILMSDGEQNTGVSPVPVVKQLAKKYPICVHTISYATTESGQENLDALSKAGNCTGVAAKASDLKSKEAQFDFLRKVLFDVEAVKVAAPAPVACPAPKKPLTVEIKVLFDFDKAVVKPEYYGEVEKFAKFAAKYPETPLLIEGHTDHKGTAAYNEKLSLRRAQAVVDILVSKFGIDKKRISAVGYGFTQPVADNATDEGRAKNRRVMGVLKNVFEDQ